MAKQSLQQLIDSHTQAGLRSLSKRQFLIWFAAASGKLFEGMLIFITGIGFSLIAADLQLSPTQGGILTGSILVGILIGSFVFGFLADYLGRKLIFIIEMLLFFFTLLAIYSAQSYGVLLLSFFISGFALGGDYPVAHIIISETMPTRYRGFIVLSAFSFQAIGAVTGAILSYLTLQAHPSDLTVWRLSYLYLACPAFFLFLIRFFIPESPHWLVEKNRHVDSLRATSQLLNIPIPNLPILTHSKKQKTTGYFYELFNQKNIRATILASLPWFLQDLGTYGIGIFTPTVIATLLSLPAHNNTNVTILKATEAAYASIFLDCFLLIGVICAIFLVERTGRIPLQITGFIGCAIGLSLAAFGQYQIDGTAVIFIICGFIVFNFSNNLGPNTITYLIAGELFPTRFRGIGAGFAASCGKVGASVTAFAFPIVLATFGLNALLTTLIITSIGGAIVTAYYRIETRGLNLETL